MWKRKLNQPFPSP
ncbi:rCG36906, partial [Rattus norvegicus]